MVISPGTMCHCVLLASIPLYYVEWIRIVQSPKSNAIQPEHNSAYYLLKVQDPVVQKLINLDLELKVNLNF